MRLRPKPPVIPPDLLDRYAEPERVFGPNMRFRIASILLGTLLLLLGVGFFLIGVTTRQARPQRDGSGGIMILLAGGLVAVGTAAIFFPMSMPLNWIYVCPKGLIRTRGTVWEAVDWADVLRFEDASFSRGAASFRQCRIITSAGTEWGFLANWVAEYGQLVAVLRQKVEKRPPTPELNN